MLLAAAAAAAARRAGRPSLRVLACAQAQAGGPARLLPSAPHAPPLAAATTTTHLRCLWSDSSASSSPTSRRYSERKLIGYTPSQIYAVVADVGSYDQFVPWCVRSTVLDEGDAPERWEGDSGGDEGGGAPSRPPTSAAGPPCGGVDGDASSAETTMEAELEVGFRAFSERYTSVVTLRPGGVVAGDGLGGGRGASPDAHPPPPAATPASITSTVRGSTLFTHLDCTWAFAPGPAPGTAWLSFGIAFEFKSPLYRAVASAFFDEVVRRMVDAFEGRCGALYGGPTVSTRRRVGVSGGGGGGVKRAGVRVKKAPAPV